MRAFLLGLVLLTGAVIPLAAQDRVWLGKARLFTNDKLGDGQDRWRSGSYALSWIRGTEWKGSAPSEFGALVEYRIRSEIIAPANLLNPVIGTDRRYVGALSFGAFSHMQKGKTDVTVGLDLVVTGPQTGIDQFQAFAHRALGLGAPLVFGSQIGNAVYPTVSLEIARDFDLSIANGRRVSFRPFFEAQAGVETFARIGGDLTFGDLGVGDMQIRSVVSGFRTPAIKSAKSRGTSFLIGGDAAYVQSSRYLPTTSGFTVQNPRVRMRAGVYSEGKKMSLFYGLTWLGKEFTNQTTSQIVGSFSVRMKF